MKSNTDYFIFGRIVGEDPIYWNLDKGWVDDFTKATPFSRDILAVPPPRGASSIMEISKDGEPLGTYSVTRGGREGKTFFTSPLDNL